MNRLTWTAAHAWCAAMTVSCSAPVSDTDARAGSQHESSSLAGVGAAATETSAVGQRAEALTTCRTQEIDTDGGHAAYTECVIDSDELFNDSVRIDGWVKDTDADGLCAQVYGYDSNGRYFESPRACPEGRKHEFHWQSWMVSDISVYLHVN